MSIKSKQKKTSITAIILSYGILNTLSLKLKKKARMPTLTTSVQHYSGDPTHGNERKKNKYNITMHRQHDWLHRKSEGIY